MKTLLKSTILSFRPCQDQANLLDKTFPGESILLTLANCQKAVREGLNLYWLAEKLFPATALKAYQDATAPAWKAHQDATDTALKAYKDATATAWKAYQDATATLFFACAQKMES